MKKIFVTLMCLTALLCANAQVDASLLERGVWKSKAQRIPAEQGMSGKMELSMEFLSPDSVSTITETSLILDLGDGLKADIYMQMHAAGNYEMRADSLIIQMNPHTARFDLNPDDIRLRGAQELDPSLVDQFKSQMIMGMTPPADAIAEEFKEPQVFIKVGYDGKKLTAFDAEGTEYIFERKKKKK